MPTGTSLLTEDGRCLFKFGVIGDIQYADCADGSDFLGYQPRYFRRTLDMVRDAVRRWTKEEVDFAVQMGDVIDGRNAEAGASLEAMHAVLSEFPAGLPRLDLLGNHELYNFQRDELHRVGLRLRAEGFPGASAPGVAGEDAVYCRFFPDGEHGKWEVIVLDAYDVSCMGRPADHPKSAQAFQLLSQLNPRGLQTGVDWFEGVPQECHRFVPFNGGVGQAQFDWFCGRLRECNAAGRKAIVMTHIPLLADSTTPKTVLWNAEPLLQAMRSEEGRCVVAVFAGHDHSAGYAVDEAGIHHVTFLSPLICPEGSGMTGAATVECYEDYAEIVGHGAFCAESGTRAQGETYSRIRLQRYDPRGW